MADRYWVGGTGTWDATSTANWSATSGGAGGASAPTSADNVIIDANSGTGTITCTGAVCNDITVTASQAITLGAASSTLSVYGNLTFPSGGSFSTGTGARTITFAATTTGKTITTNGKSIYDAVFNGVGGGWTLGSALTYSGITLTNGTFDSGSYSLVGGTILLGSGTKTLNLNNSTVTLLANIPISFATNSAGFTFNAGTSTINCSAGNPTFAGGAFTFYNVAFTSTAITTITITGANTFNDLSFATPTGSYLKGVIFSGNQTINGTLTAQSGNTDPTKRILFASDVVGTQRTITAAAIDIQCADFRDINAAGAATWNDSTRSKYWGDCLGNTGITFNAGRTVYWNLAGTNLWSSTGWAATNNGTPNAQYFPLAQDTATFTEAGTAGTITIQTFWQVGSIQMADGVSNRTTAFTLIAGSPSIYGNVTLFSNLTLTGTGTITFSGQSRTQTITSAGVTWPQPITINVPNGTVKTQDALTMASTQTLTAGTLDLNNNTLTCGFFSSSNSNTRSIAFGTGNITVTGSGFIVWDVGAATGFSYSGIPNVYATYSGSVGTRTYYHGRVGGTESNSVNLYVTGGSDVFRTALDGVYSSVKDFNFTGFSGTLNVIRLFIYGNTTFSSGMTLSADVFDIKFSATSGTQQITTNGQTLDFPITKNGAGTLQLQDALTLGATRSFTHTAGTVDLNGKTLTAPVAYSTSNSSVRSINFGNGGIISLPGSGTAFNATVATNLTTSGTGRIDMTSASAKTFAGGGASYPMLNQGGAGALTITGANTFQDLLNTVRGASIVLPAATTTTVNNLSLNGSSGNLVAITSSVSGSKATINKTSGQVGLQYCSLKDIQAQGGAKFRAPSNYGNTNVSGNAGWDFDALNTTQDNFMFFFGDTIR